MIAPTQGQTSVSLVKGLKTTTTTIISANWQTVLGVPHLLPYNRLQPPVLLNWISERKQMDG